MAETKKKSNASYYTNLIRLVMFIEGILDVVVSCVYRLILRLNEAIKQKNIFGFVVKMVTYFANKISRYYIKYYPPKDQKQSFSRTIIMWPIAASLVLINLFFDFTINYFIVFRSLNNKISWLNPAIIILLSYTYMIMSSFESCYLNSISWYGILHGGFDDQKIKNVITVFFACVGLLEALLSSLYFMITTKMVLAWAIPACILLYFIPPFIQKYVDGYVLTKCVGHTKQQKFDTLYYKIIAGYIVTANVIGLLFQLSSFTANISAGLPWLSFVTVTTLAYWFIGFYVFHALLTNSYSMMQYLYDVDFAAQWVQANQLLSPDLYNGTVIKTPQDNAGLVENSLWSESSNEERSALNGYK
ncbi:MAG: hypothetical protein P8L77_00370 [Gammaproteobacteria bacterium]|nr:hypothetical protein [Gammaproteobacteria bacterium]